ncbi:hypothetical protein MSAN_00489900 [Mycena sanguinolenta]|uniref:Transposase n=1 Tax=Mycena sanguinolenta TaxID=230812 RepID=A0A8H6Z8A2_9AGAR|nr:hypothetical protein MSAN_00489900 [Mycena sanguinolenta]
MDIPDPLDVHPEGKKDYKLCHCRSHDCGAKTWKRTADGAIRKGRWYHKGTVSKHNKEDAALIEDKTLPPAHTAVAPVPVVVEYRPPKALEVVENEGRGFGAARRRLVFLACTLVAWLHLICGLSRDASNRVLKVLGIIIAMVAAADNDQNIPKDVRTAVAHLSIEPVINRSICCPTCFRAYSLESLPKICFARKTSGSDPCNTPLWIERQTRAGRKVVPRRLYSTQNFHSWLSHFLSRPGMEELLRKSLLHRPNPNKMTSIWDSPAWQSLGTYTSGPNNLVFTWYIDWFNPFMNKIAGKTSVLRGYDRKNAYFAGITPPPKEPTVTTITALNDPIMNQFEEMWHGKMVPTHEHPEGDFYRAAIIPAIGDLMALKKALGFAGHRSHNFCSYCKLQRSEIDRLDYTNWEPRQGAEVLYWSKAWLVAETDKARKGIFREHGCRWSSDKKLTYRDPVKHTVLGPMHNVLEGILQHHCRLKWGIGSDAKARSATVFDEGSSSDSDVEMMDADEDNVEAELEDLHRDSAIEGDAPNSLIRYSSFLFIPPSDDNAMELPTEEEEEDFEEDDDEYEREKPSQKVFDSEAMAFIHTCLAAVMIPSWMDRPPVNLGEKAHGKLKADNWFVLFTVLFPMFIPELWHHPSSSQKDRKLLANFHDLVGSTNIICSLEVTPSDPPQYTEYYLRYLQSSKSLFPGLTTRPNHHYAIHNGEQMRWWGPLMKLSEFMYESHNGSLQKIKTNNHMWELDLTMLRQMCRRGRLLAAISDSSKTADSKSPVVEAMRILSPEDQVSATSKTLEQPSPGKETAYNGVGTILDVTIYEMILGYWNRNHSPPYIRAGDLTFDLLDAGVKVLPSRAVQRTDFKHNTRLFGAFGRHQANSSISFYNPFTGGKDFGYIESVWTMALEGQIRTFVVVQPHTAVSPADNAKAPYVACPGFKCFLCYTKPAHPRPGLIVELRHIISHVACFERPAGTYGIEQEITVFNDSVGRNRD